MKTVILCVLSLLLLLGNILQIDGQLDSSLFAGCGNTTTCFFTTPTDCNDRSCTGPDCDLAAIIENIPSESKLRIQLHSVRNYAYMALGFSLDQMMPQSDVVGCAKSTATVAFAKDTFNVGRVNTYDSDQSAISNFSFIISGSNFSCTFDRTYQTPSPERGFALNSRDYYLLLATRTFGFSAETEAFLMHNIVPCASSAAMNLLQANTAVSESTFPNQSIIAHGLLMLFAWQVLVVLAVVIASYTKFIFPNGEWFQAHKFINAFAILIAIISFILIFAALGGWVAGSPYLTTHQVFGILAMVLMLTNPVIAVFRCRPLTKYRWIFYVLHAGVGFSAIVCASVAIEIGLYVYYNDLRGIPIGRSAGLWIFIVWIIVVWFFYVPLTVYRVMRTRKMKMEEKSIEKVSLPDENPFKILFHNIVGIPLCPPKDQRKDPSKEWPIILTVLISFIVLSLVFYIAIIIALALA